MGRAKYKGKEVSVLLVSETHNFALISEQPDKTRAFKVDLSDMSGMDSILETLRRKKLEEKLKNQQP